jgi:F-type H+-transporting ATPase subunit b
MTRYLTAALALVTSSTLAMAAAPSDEPLTPFAGSPYQAIAALIVFIITMIILKKFAWGPIIGGLTDRENKIKADLQHAEDAAKAAAKTLEEYKAKMVAAQDEARKVIDQAKRDAQLVADQVRKQAEDEITLTKSRAMAEIQSAKEQAITEIYAQTATLATEVASKILKRNINAADQKQLVEESLTAMKQSAKN